MGWGSSCTPGSRGPITRAVKCGRTGGVRKNLIGCRVLPGLQSMLQHPSQPQLASQALRSSLKQAAAAQPLSTSSGAPVTAAPCQTRLFLTPAIQGHRKRDFAVQHRAAAPQSGPGHPSRHNWCCKVGWQRTQTAAHAPELRASVTGSQKAVFADSAAASPTTAERHMQQRSTGAHKHAPMAASSGTHAAGMLTNAFSVPAAALPGRKVTHGRLSYMARRVTRLLLVRNTQPLAAQTGHASRGYMCPCFSGRSASEILSRTPCVPGQAGGAAQPAGGSMSHCGSV